MRGDAEVESDFNLTRYHALVMQPKPLPNCVVLQTSDGDHLGFMLIAIADGASTGECVFMVLPQKPALFDAPVTRALYARKRVGESKLEMTGGETLQFRVKSPNLPDLMVELDGAGAGTWRESEPGKAAGIAVAAA